jgi:hypothetical protein
MDWDKNRCFLDAISFLIATSFNFTLQVNLKQNENIEESPSRSLKLLVIIKGTTRLLRNTFIRYALFSNNFNSIDCRAADFDKPP